MWGRRFVYLAALLSSLVFFGFYKEWFSWITLLAVVWLPWVSLLMSLPAMLTVKADLRCAGKVSQDMPARVNLQLHSVLPTPPVRCSIRLVNSLTGERFLGQPGERIPTAHCGMVNISYPELFVYDYLGLFRRRLKREEHCTLYVFPKPVPSAHVPKPQGKTVNLWRPKPGGGYSERHDLRLYRPGDDLRQIHWKMSAKTGKLIYREPMEPVQKGYLLTVTLSGSPKELDTKLGKLLWLSKALLAKQLDHQVRCVTANGVAEFTVKDEAGLDSCMHTLLSSQPTQSEQYLQTEQVAWQHHIGGGGHEA